MAVCEGAALPVNTKDAAHLLDDDKLWALEEPVTIVPRYSSDQMVDTIKGQFGPFRAHSEAKVPLWAALEMERLQQCSIQIPDWLREKELKAKRDEEKAAGAALTDVLNHYIEVAFVFLKQSKAFAGHPMEKSKTEMYLRELIELRRNKIVASLKAFDNEAMLIDVSAMSAVEVTCFRARSLNALDTFFHTSLYRKVGEREEEYTQTLDDTQQDSSSRIA